MKKQTFTKQAVWQAAAVGVLAVGGVLFCLSGQIGIGQTYRQVRVDDHNCFFIIDTSSLIAVSVVELNYNLS